MKRAQKVLNLDRPSVRPLILAMTPVLIECFRLSPKRSVITVDQISRSFAVPSVDVLDVLIEYLGESLQIIDAKLGDGQFAVVPLSHLPQTIFGLAEKENPIARRVLLMSTASTLLEAYDDAMDRATDKDNRG